jgi:hypothetical protein
MNREDIIKLAREVGYPLVEYEGTPYIPPLLAVLLETVAAKKRPDVDALVALVRADEREACAELCMDLHTLTDGAHNFYHFAANQILKRGQA